MTSDLTDKEQEVRLRAELAGLPVPPQFFQDILQGWLLIEPHLALVQAQSLPSSAEPASLFNP